MKREIIEIFFKEKCLSLIEIDYLYAFVFKSIFLALADRATTLSMVTSSITTLSISLNCETNGPSKLVLLYTKLERLDRDKHSSSLGQFVSNKEN